jgi:hypothetical protein
VKHSPTAVVGVEETAEAEVSTTEVMVLRPAPPPARIVVGTTEAKNSIETMRSGIPRLGTGIEILQMTRHATSTNNP